MAKKQVNVAEDNEENVPVIESEQTAQEAELKEKISLLESEISDKTAEIKELKAQRLNSIKTFKVDFGGSALAEIESASEIKVLTERHWAPRK